MPGFDRGVRTNPYSFSRTLRTSFRIDACAAHALFTHSCSKQLPFFRIDPEFILPPLDALEQSLAGHALRALRPHAARVVWVGRSARKRRALPLAESVGGQVILNLCTEKRALPASAVKAAVDECIEKYKKETGNERVGAKIKKEFKEEVMLDLLPRAFSKRSNTLLWLDAANKLLVVGTGSLTGADKVITCLLDALSAVPGSRPAGGFKPVQTHMSARGFDVAVARQPRSARSTSRWTATAS